jgi:hypothetical protein
MCKELWIKFKQFIKKITEHEIHVELWDELGPI